MNENVRRIHRGEVPEATFEELWYGEEGDEVFIEGIGVVKISWKKYKGDEIQFVDVFVREGR